MGSLKKPLNQPDNINGRIVNVMSVVSMNLGCTCLCRDSTTTHNNICQTESDVRMCTYHMKFHNIDLTKIAFPYGVSQLKSVSKFESVQNVWLTPGVIEKLVICEIRTLCDRSTLWANASALIAHVSENCADGIAANPNSINRIPEFYCKVPFIRESNLPNKYMKVPFLSLSAWMILALFWSLFNTYTGFILLVFNHELITVLRLQ